MFTDQQNRLSESVALFGNIILLEFFYNTAIIVFLNKHDLFLKKIDHSDLKMHFPEYTGKRNSSESQVMNYGHSFQVLKRIQTERWILSRICSFDKITMENVQCSHTGPVLPILTT